jgi:hypothetical protein
MGAMYRSAPEVEKIAERLIATVERHELLGDVRVDYVFIDQAPVSRGRLILGRARKVTGLSAYLANGRPTSDPNLDGFTVREPLFVIEISFDTWRTLTTAQKEALVDHELCHCRVGIDEKTNGWKLSTVGHDVEEFACVVERHGLWSNGLTGLGRLMSEQLSLEINDLSDPGPEGSS